MRSIELSKKRIFCWFTVAVLSITSGSYLLPGVNAQGSWVSMANAPQPVLFGASLAWTAGDHIYAFVGRNTVYFFRYSISGNSWTPMTNAPRAVYYGGCLVWTGGDCIYAFTGGGSPYFFMYSISGNSWNPMAPAGPHVHDGASLVWTGGDYIYAFTGGGAPYFLRYSITGNSWTQMPKVDQPVQPGGCLEYANRYIYAFTGNSPYFRRFEHANVAVINVTVSKTVVGQNYSMYTSVNVENKGGFTESFNVTVYANTTLIETIEITLTSGNSTTITIPWNTTGVAKGNYTITAEATPIPGETDTTDNTLTNGWVVVTIPGDVDGDFRVSYKDLFALAAAYGSKPGDSNWNPNCDIDCSGKVDYKDLFTLAANYGESDCSEEEIFEP